MWPAFARVSNGASYGEARRSRFAVEAGKSEATGASGRRNANSGQQTADSWKRDPGSGKLKLWKP
jgi:hypothetical protein